MTANRNVSTATVSRESVLNDVKQIVAEQISTDPSLIKEEQLLVEDLGYDSLDKIETTMEVEDHFDISIPDDLADQVRRVGDIVDGVVQLLCQDAPQ